MESTDVLKVTLQEAIDNYKSNNSGNLPPLSYFLGNKNVSVRLAAASFLDFPPEYTDTLVSDPDIRVIEAAILNQRRLDKDSLIIAMTDSDQLLLNTNIIKAVAGAAVEHDPELLAYAIRGRDPELQSILLDRDGLDSSVLALAAINFANEDILKKLINYKDLPVQAVSLLARNANPKVRLELASSRDLPDEVQVILANDPDPLVVEALVGRKNLSITAMQIIATGTYTHIKAMLLDIYTMPENILMLMLSTTDTDIAMQILELYPELEDFYNDNMNSIELVAPKPVNSKVDALRTSIMSALFSRETVERTFSNPRL